MANKMMLHDAIRQNCRNVKFVKLSSRNTARIMSVEKALELDNIEIDCRGIYQIDKNTVAIFY